MITMLERVARSCPIVVVLAMAAQAIGAQNAAPGEPIRHTLAFRGAEREYFVSLPPGFSRDGRYWPLIVVGTPGRNYFLTRGIAQVVAETRFDAIVISPISPADDLNAIRFPALGEGDFIQDVLKDAGRKYPLKPKMLLTGYSRGGQLAHRFALAFPEQVEAVAPLASGTWTTPDGRVFVEELGEVQNPRAFLENASNAASAPERLRDLFNSRVASVADAKAAAGAQKIPFLVMCGTVDPRLAIAKEFVRSLEGLKYQVSAVWPRTPHVCAPPDDACHAEYNTEFQKYPRETVEFFRRVTQARAKAAAGRP